MRRSCSRWWIFLAALGLPCVAVMSAADEVRWVDIATLGVEGKGWSDTDASYRRLPSKAAGVVPDAVYNLSKDSSGILVRFVSDATTIKARWSLTSFRLAMPHMAATGVSGLDLYVRDSGNWSWVAVGQPKSQTNTVDLVTGLQPGEREFLLYLPLYNGVHSVELGVAENARLQKAGPWGQGTRKPIVFYGTSITQGGCASRPGMVHTAIIGRHFNWPTINLGFSGSGKMEMAMCQLLAELDAGVYVLDCLPNMDEAMLRERFEPFVRRLREARPTVPIVLVEDRTYTDAHLRPERRQRNDTNRSVALESYKRLKKEGIGRLYYVKGEELLGADHEGTVDGSHPTDLGFMRQATVLSKTLKPLLKPGR